MRTTCSLWMPAAARASRKKRATAWASWLTPGVMSLMAMRWPSSMCSTRTTTPMPPAPRVDSTRYLPASTSPGCGVKYGAELSRLPRGALIPGFTISPTGPPHKRLPNVPPTVAPRLRQRLYPPRFTMDVAVGVSVEAADVRGLVVEGLPTTWRRANVPAGPPAEMSTVTTVTTVTVMSVVTDAQIDAAVVRVRVPEGIAPPVRSPARSVRVVSAVVVIRFDAQAIE